MKTRQVRYSDGYCIKLKDTLIQLPHPGFRILDTDYPVLRCFSPNSDVGVGIDEVEIGVQVSHSFLPSNVSGVELR